MIVESLDDSFNTNQNWFHNFTSFFGLLNIESYFDCKWSKYQSQWNDWEKKDGRNKYHKSKWLTKLRWHLASKPKTVYANNVWMMKVKYRNLWVNTLLFVCVCVCDNQAQWFAGKKKHWHWLKKNFFARDRSIWRATDTKGDDVSWTSVFASYGHKIYIYRHFHHEYICVSLKSMHKCAHMLTHVYAIVTIFECCCFFYRHNLLDSN